MDDIHSSLTDDSNVSNESSLIDDSNVSNEVTHSPPTASGVTNRRDPRPFPLSLIVDQQEIKHALLLSAVNPRSIGVVLSGGRGTGKAVIVDQCNKLYQATSLALKDSEYNIGPTGQDGIDSMLLQQLRDGEKTIDSLETELIPTPFVNM